MQQLTVVTRLFPLILSGEKTSTIRWRETVISPGQLSYICDSNPQMTAVVRVIRCTDMPLSEVSDFLGRVEDWPDDVLLEGMREHYPEITLSDVVQVIEHLTPIQTVAQQ